MRSGEAELSDSCWTRYAPGVVPTLRVELSQDPARWPALTTFADARAHALLAFSHNEVGFQARGDREASEVGVTLQCTRQCRSAAVVWVAR